MTPPTPTEAALIARLNRELLYKRELARLIRDGWIDGALARWLLAAYRSRDGVFS